MCPPRHPSHSNGNRYMPSSQGIPLRRLDKPAILQKQDQSQPGDGAAALPAPVAQSSETASKRLKSSLRVLAAFVGPGLVASIAYIDPGNWSTDLSAGTSFGYAHLFVILMASLFAIVLQTLSCRIGIVTGRDLAQHLRASLHNRPNHTLLWRWLCLYGLYSLYEFAIVATDLAEMLGSAIAINLMCSRIPIWAGCLLTSADVIIVLALFSSYPSSTRTRSMRIFELLVALLILVVLACMAVLMHRLKPHWGRVFRGYVPSKGLFQSGSVYQSIGIMGATIMPHAVLLGSRIATTNRLSSQGVKFSDPVPRSDNESAATLQLFEQDNPRIKTNRSVDFIRSHIKNASIDVALSLITVATVINSSILIIAAAAFHNPEGEDRLSSGDLFSAHRLIRERVGSAPAFLFALGLLCAGQAASVTVTLSGQVISEGMLEWRIQPWLRRMITRLIGLIPTLIVTVSAGREAIDTLLVASQVALSVVLPFVIFPLVLFTSSAHIMSTAKETEGTEDPTEQATAAPEQVPPRWKRWPLWLIGRPTLSDQWTSFANRRLVSGLGWLLFVLISVCNVVGIVEIGLGKE